MCIRDRQSTWESEFETKRLMHIIFCVIKYLHDNKLTHRDLKPSNFLFGRRGVADGAELMLIDFGLSRRLPEVGSMKTMVGSALYTAPEVYEENYDEKCDCWSLGVIMYVLLSGSPPFFGSSHHDYYEAAKRGEIDLDSAVWQTVSAKAKDLIKKLLTVDPAMRISVSEALRHPWMDGVSYHGEDVALLERVPLMMERLNSFEDMPLFKKLIVRVVSTMINVKETERLRKIFKLLDPESCGRVLVQGKSIEDDENPNSGVITFSEFVAGTLDARVYMDSELLRRVFKVFDIEQLGCIKFERFQQIMKRRGEIRTPLEFSTLSDIL
eukprot:TRINITY_DN4373_c0_g2_i1.p1 TRINITY_DN4373_c0_g2~~TRINITY_DN4373_c0_g2_i1.p1  ORF type:complete len:352 (-),score=53.59 TRINITY_DN4373_c0_g2_i1:15-989(-)